MSNPHERKHVAEAVKRLEWAYTLYSEWYGKGPQHEAGNVASSLVSEIREALQILWDLQREECRRC